MKVTTTYHRKEPVPGVEYASEGFHCTIETEPPHELREDKAKLRQYVQALFRECRERVEHEFAQQQEKEQGSTERPVRRTATRRQQFTAPRGSGRSNGHAGNGHASNGHSANGCATPKQVNFVRALATQGGMSYDELADLAAELFGKGDLRTLTKREASRLIDELRIPEGQ